MLECVVNVSEGRRLDIVERLGELGGALDVHTDADHNRSVFTCVGEMRPRLLAEAAVMMVDMRGHDGVHPCIGAVDVVPFVPLGELTMEHAIGARNLFAEWFSDAIGVPCFLYGPDVARPQSDEPGRTLPDVRRSAFVHLAPDFGPPTPHLTAGACAVGARPALVAYNVWLDGHDLGTARDIARHLRGPAVRALGLQVGDQVQVSMNLIDPLAIGPVDVVDAIADRAAVSHAELVGLVPDAVLRATPADRWQELDLSVDRTIEARVAAQGLSES